MSNKLKWFTHDHDAHEDTWIRHLVRTNGHVAGWLWWVILEQMHKHGVGDVLKRDINDISRAAMTSTSVVTRVLTQMAAEYEGQTKLSFILVGTELELKIKKFRERQSNLKSKTISRPFQDHFKTTQEEKDKDKDNTNSRDRLLGMPYSTAFEAFFRQYPKQQAKAAAGAAWDAISPDASLSATIIAALYRQKPLIEDLKYFPNADKWLLGRRWEDEIDGKQRIPESLIDRNA